jgi:hypothetical protein
MDVCHDICRACFYEVEIEMGVLHIILKVGHPKIISTQISEQMILM